MSEPLRAKYLHQAYAIDFQFDRTMDGRTLKSLNVIDEFNRGHPAILKDRRYKAMDVIGTLEELLKVYPKPTHLRTDNVPEFITHTLQEWCTVSSLGPTYIPPGSPWENRCVESFDSRFRNEFQKIAVFTTA